MQKKFLPVVIAMGFALALPALAANIGLYAGAKFNTGTSTGTTTKGMIRGEIKDIRENAQGEIKDIREGAKSQIKDMRGELRNDIWKMRVTQTVKIFTATANRLDKIAQRIESRIMKIKAAGGDTTAMEASLGVAKQKIVDARAAISVFAAIDISTATSTTTQKAMLDSIKTDAQVAKTALKAAHAALVNTITIIIGKEKTLKVKEDGNVNSTTTASTTTQI